MDDVDAFFEHHGIKGQKWGVRREDLGGVDPYRLQPAGPVVDASLPSSTQKAGRQVAFLMDRRYGFQITAINSIKPDNPEYAYGTVGYVKSTPGVKGGVIFARQGNITKMLKTGEDEGWFGQDCGTTQALFTHESAHALFHAPQETKVGFLGPKTFGGDIKARDKALRASIDAARRDGISARDFPAKVSGYSGAARMREETEAELFTQYHWSSNPPNYVKVWGETLHKEMGIDATPFREDS